MQWLERLTQKGCIPPENGPNLLGPWQQVGDAGLVGCDIPRRYSTVGAGGVYPILTAISLLAPGWLLIYMPASKCG